MNALFNKLYKPTVWIMRDPVFTGSPADNHRLWINQDWRAVLEQNKLNTFDALYDIKSPESVRKKINRSIVTFCLNVGEDGRRFFLKRHDNAPSARKAPGPLELRNILAVSSAGIVTVEPVVAGFDPDSGRSLLVTAQIPDSAPLDRFLADEVEKSIGGSNASLFYRELGAKVAKLASAFHGAGFNHRDLYLCHIFVRLESVREFCAGKGPVVLTLLDLQRVDYRKYYRWRWIVKDLAQLLYSCRAVPVFRTDILRFALAYFNVDKFGSRERRMAAAVMRKTTRIARHDRKRIMRQARENAARKGTECP